MDDSVSTSHKRLCDTSSPPHEIQRLDTIVLPISEKQHAEQDQHVLELLAFVNIPDELNLERASLLLSQIVCVAGNQMDRTYCSPSNIRKLLQTNNLLMEELKDAWSNKRFSSIRSLRMLQDPSLISKTPSQMAVGRQLNSDLHSTITSAWNGQYVGNYHHVLYNNINNMPRSRPYSNSVAIIQSSGSGKSRMVHEQSNLVFTIPFNLHSQADERDLPLRVPVPDAMIRIHLVESVPKDNIANVQLYYFVFLKHLFYRVRTELEFLYGGKSRAATHAALATSWHNHLETGVRDKLYREVVESASRLPLVCPATMSVDVGFTISMKMLDKALDEYQHASMSNEDLDLCVATTEAQHEFTQLLSTIDRYVNSPELGVDDVRVVIYFDEADILTNTSVPSNPDNTDLYDVLCSCFNAFLGEPLFVIYLSTKLHLEQSAPSRQMASSARAYGYANALQAPINETPFDCAKDLYIRPGKCTLQDICTIEFMSMFGRPMFWSLIEGAGSHKREVVSQIIDLARAKLICSHNIDVSHRKLTPEGRLAVLDMRLMLTWEPRYDAYRTEARLVASHMRLVYSIPKDRVYLQSGYSSEPILGEAAAQQCYVFRKNHSTSVILDILAENLGGGLLDLGERGEVVARVIITSAYDRAVERDHPPPKHNGTPPFYSQGCRLITFIEELFTAEYAEEILDSRPENVKSKVPLREAFKDARLRFTHFAKMADDTGTSTAAMYAAFIRGMAIICMSTQRVVDVMLPVLLIDDPLREEIMTSLMIQLKRRGMEGNKATYIVDETTIQFFPTASKTRLTGDDASNRPYITLVMDLGVQAPSNTSAEACFRPRLSPKPARSVEAEKPQRMQLDTQQTPLTASLPQQGERKYAMASHPRYSIFAYGCSDMVYKVIDPKEKAIYARLLASGDSLSEHPRQDSDSLKAVRKMKPFWVVGEGCYHWLESELLNMPVEVDDTDVAWLVTGNIMESDD
ncbi:hypothetical protein K439DRAFT_1665120 [Ramaria rubella]|nr:hypothetical protein K439DRAFT_1665120 [Ramaria rubella]